MPKKVEEILIDRAKYIQERINKAEKTTMEVEKLSKELFLSERQIYRDLKKK